MKVSFECSLVFNSNSERSQARRRKQKPQGGCRRCHREKVITILLAFLFLVLAQSHPEYLVALVQLLDNLWKLLSLFGETSKVLHHGRISRWRRILLSPRLSVHRATDGA
jgi:hypothetical protein